MKCLHTGLHDQVESGASESLRKKKKRLRGQNGRRVGEILLVDGFLP